MQVCMHNLVLDVLFRFDLPAPQWGTHHPKSRPASASNAKQKPATNPASGGLPLQNLLPRDQGVLTGTSGQASSAAGASSSTVQSSSQGQSSSQLLESAPQQPAGTVPPQLQGQGPQVIQVNQTEDYLMVCIKRKRPFKERSDIKITMLTRDREAFEEIRAEYKRIVSRWHRFLSLFSVQNINFVQVQVPPS